jgi:hypothetical protein
MRKMPLFLITLFVSGGFCVPAMAVPMQAGAAWRVVTPDPLLPVSGGVGEPEPVSEKKMDLFARAMVFEKDGVRVAIVGMDFLGWSKVLGDKTRAQVKGIPPENILIGATHTHSAPDTYGFPDEKGRHGADVNYLNRVCDLTAEAINEAIGKLTPVNLKIAVGDAKGKIAYNYYAPQLYDPRCGVIQAIGRKGKEKGKVVATLINYASHPEVLGNSRGILSPDYCGPLYEKIEEETGGMALFMNGALGGMVTADNRTEKGKDARTWEECVRIGELLASEALRIVEKAPVQEDPALFCAAETIHFPIDSKMLRYVLSKSPLGYELPPDGNIPAQLNLVNIGTAQLLTLPGEVLPNAGCYLKRNMPADHAFLLGLTNDAFGYIMAKVDWRSFKRYDYISFTCLGEMTGEILIEEALDLIAASPKPDPAP